MRRHQLRLPPAFAPSAVYNGQLFNSVDALITAYNTNPAFRKVRLPPDEADWSSMRRRGTVREGANLAMPSLVQPSGRRFVVDGWRVSWMGWQFHVGHTLRAGLVFRDLRFKGERIIYELGLQEAYASYSGYTPVQASTIYTGAALS